MSAPSVFRLPRFSFLRFFGFCISPVRPVRYRILCAAVFQVCRVPCVARAAVPPRLFFTQFSAAAPLFCRRQKILLRDTQKKHPQCAKHRRCKLKLKQSNYSLIAITTPEPTVLPPSRIAKRSPFSIAMGLRSSTSISTLSPGMHISVPSGREITPVTSVVLK